MHARWRRLPPHYAFHRNAGNQNGDPGRRIRNQSIAKIWKREDLHGALPSFVELLKVQERIRNRVNWRNGSQDGSVRLSFPVKNMKSSEHINNPDVIIEILQKCFPDELSSDAGEKRMRTMVPSYDQDLSLTEHAQRQRELSEESFKALNCI